MTAQTRIGEILLRHELVDQRTLMRALGELAGKGERLVSMLITQALIDFDDGCMALSEQLGYPAALESHFEDRDASLAKSISPDVYKRWAVVPIARTRSGSLVLCARDPSPALAAGLRRELGEDIELAIAPAIHIRRFVRAACGAPPDEHPPELPSADEPPPTIWRRRSITGLLVADPTPRPTSGSSRPPPQSISIPTESGPEEERASSSPSSASAQRSSETPTASTRQTRKTITFAFAHEPVEETTVGLPPTRAPAPPTQPPPLSTAPPPLHTPTMRSARFPNPELARAPATLSPSPAREIERALSRATADQLVIKHAATDWRSALLVTITGDTAHGTRGHGVRLQNAERISFSVASSSLLRVTRETASVTMAMSQSPTPDQLIALLGLPAAAAPVIVEQQIVVAILVVGEPVRNFGEAVELLPRLADALAAAYRRCPNR